MVAVVNVNEHIGIAGYIVGGLQGIIGESLADALKMTKNGKIAAESTTLASTENVVAFEGKGKTVSFVHDALLNNKCTNAMPDSYTVSQWKIAKKNKADGFHRMCRLSDRSKENMEVLCCRKFCNFWTLDNSWCSKHCVAITFRDVRRNRDESIGL